MNLRIAIDGFMILSLIFAAGIGWQKLGQLEDQVSRLVIQDASRSGASERLARIETTLEMVRRDVDRLNRKLDGD